MKFLIHDGRLINIEVTDVQNGNIKNSVAKLFIENLDAPVFFSDTPDECWAQREPILAINNLLTVIYPTIDGGKIRAYAIYNHSKKLMLGGNSKLDYAIISIALFFFIISIPFLLEFSTGSLVSEVIIGVILITIAMLPVFLIYNSCNKFFAVRALFRYILNNTI